MNARVTLLGLPWDRGSSFLRGAAEAPAAIREALHSPSANLATESGLDLGAEARFRDAGDLDLAARAEDPRAAVEGRVGELLDRGEKVLSLGGDHSLSWPILRAYGARYEGLTVLQLDAHPDLYDQLDGDRRSHACPFARVMEEKLAARLVQVGVRTMNPHQRAQAERFAVEVVDMRRFAPDLDLDLASPTYLSLDLDVLDPAFAPGVSHPEPGGPSVREVLGLVQGLPTLAGADVVELNPRRDPAGLTARVAAKLVKEIAARML